VYEAVHTIVIQIDGAQHSYDKKQQAKDIEHNALAVGAGFRVLRVWHGDVEKLNNMIEHAVLLAMMEPSCVFSMHSAGLWKRVPGACALTRHEGVVSLAMRRGSAFKDPYIME
jgi:hypothetical protein